MFKDCLPGTPAPRRVTRPMDFIVWFLVLLFVCAVAFRANAQSCITIEQARELSDRNRAALQTLNPDETRKAINLYDSTPPETISGAVTAVLIHMADGAGLIAVGPPGLLCGRMTVPSSEWERIVAQITGARS
jgi:hypothetical protein